jgi:hypothetical protein
MQSDARVVFVTDARETDNKDITRVANQPLSVNWIQPPPQQLLHNNTNSTTSSSSNDSDGGIALSLIISATLQFSADGHTIWSSFFYHTIEPNYRHASSATTLTSSSTLSSHNHHHTSSSSKSHGTSNSDTNKYNQCCDQCRHLPAAAVTVPAIAPRPPLPPLRVMASRSSSVSLSSRRQQAKQQQPTCSRDNRKHIPHGLRSRVSASSNKQQSSVLVGVAVPIVVVVFVLFVGHLLLNNW